MYKHLYDINVNENVTILAVDQNVKEIADISHYLYVLKLGRKQTEGPSENFRDRLDEVTKDWLRA